EIIKNSFLKILLIDPQNYSINFFKELDHIDFDLILFTHRDSKGFLEALRRNLPELSKRIGPIEPADFGSIEPADFGPIEPADFGPIEPADFGPIEPEIKYLLAANLNSNSKYLRDFIYKCAYTKYTKLLDF